jgi:hypothetical protein
MTERQDRQRAERDQDRSEEARWQVAEAGAEKDEEERLDAADQSLEQQEDWENEGGSLERERNG